ncbi:MAG: glycosyltransferase family 87 protein [Tepidisphaeraceae bacterium]
MALFVFTCAIGNAVLLARESSPRLGLDFIAFYTAGTFVREGRANEFYDLKAVVAYQESLAKELGTDLGGGFGPWWNPPHYALVFVPFSLLPFQSAVHAWVAVNLVAVGMAIWLMARMLPREAGWRTWGLVPLLVLASTPFILLVSHGQNTGTSLLIVALVVTAWRAERGFMAGLVLGLLFYKPQLATVLAVVLVLDRGWRAAAGVATTGFLLLLLTQLMLPGSIGDFLRRLPENLHAMQVGREYMWERHVTIKAFWRLLLQGRGPGEMAALTTGLTLACTAFVGCGLLAAIYRRRHPQPNNTMQRDRLIGATVVCMPLVMPFYFDYDLLLLSIPAVLWAAEVVESSSGATHDTTRTLERREHWMLAAFVVLFVWLMVANHVTAQMRFNLTVPLVAVIASVSIARAVRSDATPVEATEMIPLAAAA